MPQFPTRLPDPIAGPGALPPLRPEQPVVKPSAGPEPTTAAGELAPTDQSQTRPRPAASFEPVALPTPPTPAVSETLPEPLRESYTSLGTRLKADPQVNYIAIDSPAANQGLSEFLTRFQTQLDSVPGLRDKLTQSEAGRQLLEALDSAARGQLSSADILKLQSFIVSAGENISHPNSASGIDGAFGPRTHQGLQNAFARLLAQPDQTIANFSQNYGQAQQSSAARLDDYANMGGDIPTGGYREPAGPTPECSTPPPLNRQATATGQQILSAVDRTRGPMRQYLNQHGGFYCYRGVKQVLQQLQPPVSLNGGSAYMAADQLRSRYSDRFEEVRLSVPPNQATRDYLKSLPAGAVVVWGPSNNPAKRAEGLRQGNGYAHGHISVALGNGYEFSDRDRPQITGSSDPERYGSLTVFLPRERAAD